jgi:ABC transporter.
LLEVLDLTKSFKKNLAVNGVNLFIGQGEIVGLLGPNGAGKSTTISMIATLLEPSGGDIRLFSESILRHPEKIRAILGVVPQEIALYADLTAEENLEFFGRIYRIKGQDLKRRIREVLETVGLADKAKERVKRFSGGMKRRLNIGVALLHEPQIVIMDEPTVGIDPQSRFYILETVKRLNREKGITILYTSHYMEEVEYLCERIYIMDQGHIIASGTKEELKNILSQENTITIKADQFREAFVDLLREEPLIRRVTVQENSIHIIVPKEINLFQRIFSLAEQTGTELLAIEVKTATLEDVFLHLTGRALRD